MEMAYDLLPLVFNEEDLKRSRITLEYKTDIAMGNESFIYNPDTGYGCTLDMWFNMDYGFCCEYKTC